jgi:uncharacterized repeat protein (TIGR01451 family)
MMKAFRRGGCVLLASAASLLLGQTPFQNPASESREIASQVSQLNQALVGAEVNDANSVPLQIWLSRRAALFAELIAVDPDGARALALPQDAIERLRPIAPAGTLESHGEWQGRLEVTGTRWNLSTSGGTLEVFFGAQAPPQAATMVKLRGVRMGERVAVERSSAGQPGTVLGTASILEGPNAGADTELLETAGNWTAQSNASWLHVATGYSSGAGNAVVQFSFDANMIAAVRSGTLTVAGQTVTVTQAGSGYTAMPVPAPDSGHLEPGMAANSVAVDGQGNEYVAYSGGQVWEYNGTYPYAFPLFSGLNNPEGIALDGQDNIYVADTYNNAIKEWSPSTKQVSILVSGLNSPAAAAVDGEGNVYFADTGNNAIKEWNAATLQVTTLVSSGLNQPNGIAVDLLGNVYIADTGNNAIKQWSAATQLVTTLVSGLNSPNGVAVDGQGNLYIADTGNNVVEKWFQATGQLAEYWTQQAGLFGDYVPAKPHGVAVDTQGNLYLVLPGLPPGTVYEFSFTYLALSYTARTESAPPGTDSILVATLPASVGCNGLSTQNWLTNAVVNNGVGTFSFTYNNTGSPRAAALSFCGVQVFITQTATGGSATLAAVMSHVGDFVAWQTNATYSVMVSNTGYGPTNDTVQVAENVPTGLTLVSMSGSGWTCPPGGTTCSRGDPLPSPGTYPAVTVTMSVTAGAGTVVTNQVTASGGGSPDAIASDPATISAPGAALSTASALEGPSAGADAVFLVMTPSSAAWTAQSNASWLHLSNANRSGAGSALVQFTYDANAGSAVRSGTLTIGGQTLTVTQAGSGYTAAVAVTTLVSSGLNHPQGVAVDASGNVYIADTWNGMIKKWDAVTHQVTTLVPNSGTNEFDAVAVDGQGNVYIADSAQNALDQWSATTQQLTTLVSSGMDQPNGIAVDAQGNLYTADTYNSAIKRWNTSSQELATLTNIANEDYPYSVALDPLGNVYFSEGYAIGWWSPATQQASTPLGLNYSNPRMAADAHGDLYVADNQDNAIKMLNPATQQAVTVVATGLSEPEGVAVDTQGNVYIADTGNAAVKVVSQGYLALASTTASELANAGSDSVAVQVLPATMPLSAASDQSWLGITGAGAGMVSFSFLANSTGASRVAHITVLGQTVTVTQSAVAGVPSLSIAETRSGPFAQGQGNAVYTITVTNSGTGPTSGTVTVTDTLPAGLTLVSISGGSEWSCPAGGTICTSTASINAGASYQAITLTVSVAPNALPFVPNQVSVSGCCSATAVETDITPVLGVFLGTTSILVTPAAGTGTLLLATAPAAAVWSAQSNASWLHVSAGSANGTGNAVIYFTYDANSGSALRSGTLTIAGQTVTVEQPGAGYHAAVTSIPFLGPAFSSAAVGVAVDAQGDTYFSERTPAEVVKWNFSNGQFATLQLSGGNAAPGLAVDNRGDVYIAESAGGAIAEWNPFTGQVTTLLSSNLNPHGVAVDAQGNVYIADSDGAIKEWSVTSQQLSTLVSATEPGGIAVDVQGNVYFTNVATVEKWNPLTQQVSTVVSAGLGSAAGVAVDGQGNVYIADLVDAAVKTWSAASQQLTTLISAGLLSPAGVAVDPQGNVYVADVVSNEITVGYVSLAATAVTESSGGGSDSVGVQVVPASLPVNATSDQTWLTIGTGTQETGTQAAAMRATKPRISTGSSSINYSFTANTTGVARTAHINVLGQQITVTQPGDELTVSGPATLPVGTLNVAYPSTTVTATAGDGSYSWSATGLPAGLTLASGTGTISGTPWSTGNAISVRVTVTDGTGAQASASYSLRVNCGSACDFDNSGSADVSDAQYIINEALGRQQAADDLNHDGVVNVVEIQMVINAVLGVA